MKLPSTKVFLALGLSSLLVTLVLAAAWLGLVPDREAEARRARVSLAETTALMASTLLDEDCSNVPTPSMECRINAGGVKRQNCTEIIISLHVFNGVPLFVRSTSRSSSCLQSCLRLAPSHVSFRA